MTALRTLTITALTLATLAGTHVVAAWMLAGLEVSK